MRKRGVSPGLIITLVVIVLAVIVFYSLYQNSPSEENLENPNQSENASQQFPQEPIEKTHLTCIDYRCVQVAGQGSNYPGCSSIGNLCNTQELCGNNICDPGIESSSTCSLDCTNKPADLIIKTPLNISKFNDGILIRAQIQNIGGTKAKVTRSRIRIKNENIDSLTSQISPGQSQDFTQFISLVQGEYEITIVADLNNEVDESNENNNLLKTTYTLT